MITTKVPKFIDQPNMPQNYYGMSFAINNIVIGDQLYLGERKAVDLLRVLEIFFHDEMYYLTVVDSISRQYTIRYNRNARVNTKSKVSQSIHMRIRRRENGFEIEKHSGGQI